MIEAYPLCWPEGEPRTTKWRRERGKFNKKTHVRHEYGGYQRTNEISVNDGVQRVIDQLELMGVDADSVIISTNLQVRADGLPRSKQARPDDPGVAVYWKQGDSQKVIPIDKYDLVEHNLAAIAATISALRGIERWGGARILERAFSGFTRLTGPDHAPHWREVLGVKPTDDMQTVKQRYRELRSMHHPDNGGDPAQFDRVNKAYATAIEAHQ